MLQSFLRRIRRQKAVYWAPGLIDENGRQQFKPPVEIKCRWEDVSEEFVDTKGDRRLSKCKVYPDRELAPDGALKKGSLTDLPREARDCLGPFDPWKFAHTFQIYRFDQVPDFRGRPLLYLAWL